MKEEGDSVPDSAELRRKRPKQSIQSPAGNSLGRRIHAEVSQPAGQRTPEGRGGQPGARRCLKLAGDCRIKTPRGCGSPLTARGSHHGGTPIRSMTIK